MDTAEKKEILKRYLEAVKSVNNDPDLAPTQHVIRPFKYMLCIDERKRSIEYYGHDRLLMTPYAFLITGYKRAAMMGTLFTYEEVKTVVTNMHLAGDLIQKEYDIVFDLAEPIKAGEMTDPFFRMFNELDDND